MLYRATDQFAAGGELQVPSGDWTPGWRAGAGGAGAGDLGPAAARPRRGHGGHHAAEVREQDPAHPGLGLQQGQGSGTRTLQVQMITDDNHVSLQPVWVIFTRSDLGMLIIFNI